MTTDNFGFYLQNRLIQTSQTGGQQYSDTCPLVFPGISYTFSLHTAIYSLSVYIIEQQYFKDFYAKIFTMDKLQLTGRNLGEFSTLEVSICMKSIFGVISKTA